jgi:hypothetical protein
MYYFWGSHILELIKSNLCYQGIMLYTNTLLCIDIK